MPLEGTLFSTPSESIAYLRSKALIIPVRIENFRVVRLP